MVSTTKQPEFDLGPFYEAKKFSIEGCWTTCGGSSCCKMSRFLKNTKFADKEAHVIYIFDFEMDWLLKNDQLDPEFAKTLVKHEFIVNNWTITFYAIKCGYGGLCPNHKFRPLSCFLYPRVPYFEADGKISKLANFLFFDDIFDSMNIKKPCTIFPNFTHETYQTLVDKYLSFPKFYFYINVYYRIKEIMMARFNIENDRETIEEAMEIYEAMFTLNALVTPEEIATIVIEENAKFKVFE